MRTNFFPVKTIEHFYSADLNWVENLAQQFGGKVDGNFIVIPEDIQTGTRYFLEIEEGIVAYYLDVEYKKNLHLIQKNNSSDFVGFYYNLTDGEATTSVHNFLYNTSRWQYNLAVIDGSLDSEYKVKVGSKTFAICFFIKKSIIKRFMEEHKLQLDKIDDILDITKNTMIRFDRISNDTFHLLDDLRKIKIGGPIFNLNFTGTVYMLMSNFIRKIAEKRVIIQTVNQEDLSAIIAIQMYLIENIEGHFPSIKFLADKANMSESKFKSLFNKITGSTPNMFFIENKLLLGKDLLETKEMSISQISDKLNFTNNSYFAAKFKEHFGISPKTFVKEL